jgi:RecA/RadA recombinase
MTSQTAVEIALAGGNGKRGGALEAAGLEQLAMENRLA